MDEISDEWRVVAEFAQYVTDNDAGRADQACSRPVAESVIQLERFGRGAEERLLLRLAMALKPSSGLSPSEELGTDRVLPARAPIARYDESLSLHEAVVLWLRAVFLNWVGATMGSGFAAIAVTMLGSPFRTQRSSA